MRGRPNPTRWLAILFAFALTACQSTSNPTPLATISPSPTLAFVTNTSEPQPTAANPPTPTALPTVPASVIELEGADILPGFSIVKFAEIYRPTSFSFDTQ